MYTMLNLAYLNTKISNANPVFDWTNSAYLINKDEWQKYYAFTKDHVTYVDYEVEWYWGLISIISLPNRAISKSSRLVNDQLVKDIKFLQVSKTISDFTWGFWTTYIANEFDAYVETIDWIDVLFFEKKSWSKEELTYWYTHEEIVDLLLLKEFLEWKFHVDIEWMSKKAIVPTQFIKLDTLWLTVPFNYTAAMRYSLNHKWKFYERTWKLMPTSMYANLMLSWWIHTHTASRRYGKTRWMLPEIKAEVFDLQFTERPKKIVYIAPSTWRLATMRRYLQGAFQWEIAAGIMSNLNSDNRMVLYRFDDKWDIIEPPLSEIQLYSAQEDDVWVGDYYDVCFIDEVERMLPRNPNVLSDVLSIATNEFGSLRLVSTINKQGRYTDFIKYLQLGEQKKTDYKQFLLGLYYKYKLNELDYKKLEKRDKKEIAKLLAVDFNKIKREMKFAIDYTSLRVPWDNVETYTPEEKAQIKKVLLNEWILSYITEWLCQLPDEVHSVEFEQQIVDHTYFEWKKYDHIIMAYDVSDKIDKWSVVFYWYDISWNSLDMFKEIELKGDINSQYDAVLNIYKTEAVTYTRTWSKDNVHFIYDHRWIGTGLRPLFDRDKIPVICFNFTSWQSWNKEDRQYNVGKNYAYNLLKFNIATWSVLISSACASFIDEFKHFKEDKNDSWYVKVAAEYWFHDDFVTSWLMANWFAMDILWAKHTLNRKGKPQEVEVDIDPWVEMFWRLHDWSITKDESIVSSFSLFWY